MKVDEIMERCQIESKQKWREEIATMPWIQFPADWKIQIIPPFGDAVVRFRVTLPSGAVRSVYLDARCSLGVVLDENGPIPYWEVYPHQGDVGRCDKENVAELLAMIADEGEEE